MRNSIYFKYIIGYLVMALIIIVSINVFIQPSVYKYNSEEIGTSTYRLASAISQKISSNPDSFFSQQSDTNAINLIANTTNTTILFVNANGVISYSSNKSEKKSLSTDFISSYFEGEYYEYGTLNGLFNQPYISAIAPVVAHYQTIGYIIVGMSESYLDVKTVHTMNYIYIIAGLIMLTSFIFLIIFTFSTYIPIRRITRATKEYANGNYDYDGLKIKSHDEMGTLAASVKYMARQIHNIDEKQRKFISNCSHDFRSPLTSIKGYLEAMIDGTIPPELYDKYLKIVLSEATRLTNLTSSLLSINSWNASGQILELSDFNIVDTMRNTIASFEVQCTKKKISMDVTYVAETLMVNADMIKIQQVIYNLIDNAIKFSYQNSRIFVSVTERSDKVFVSIKDNGIGMPKDALNKIWDRFYKVDSSRGKDKMGSGLGLSIVKEVISSHNENINVISTESVGTEFIFTLSKSKRRS